MAGKTLASKTGQVRFSVPGAAGPIGPLIYPAGEYSATTQYIRTTLSAPMVLDDGQYYVLNKEGAFTGIRPKTDYATNGSNATWVLMEYVKYAFMEILMANFAKLASAVFYEQYMFSQQGVDADGNPTSDYQNFTGEDGKTFQPNILLNFLTGKAYLSEAEIRGRLTTAINGKRIELDPDTNSLRMYDENENLVCRFYFKSNGTPPSYPYIEMAQFDNSGKQISSLEMMPAVINEWVQMDGYTLGWTMTPTVGLQFTRNGEVKKSYPSS